MKIKASDISERKLMLREPKSGKEAEVAGGVNSHLNRATFFGVMEPVQNAQKTILDGPFK